MIEHLEAYLKDHETAWSPTTLKSESSRLRRALSISQVPSELYERLLKTHKPYTIKTTFIGLSRLEKWCAERGHIKKSMGFHEFVRKHRNKFKHVYDRVPVACTYDQALSRIGELREPYKTAAMELLKTGLRISEPARVAQGCVVGKGGKKRRVFGEITTVVPKSTLHAKLQAVGLKPHDLRKLFATRLAERGAAPADLCRVMGWSSLETAYRYLQPKDDQKIEEMLR